MNNGTAQPEKEVATQAIPTLLQYLIYGSFALAIVSTLVGLLFSLGEKTALVSVLGIMAGVLVLVQALPRVVEFAIGPVKAKLGRVEQRQALQESEIKAIQIALKGILTKHETGPLTGLNGPEEVPIQYEPDLYGYLHRLDGLGFIQPNKGYGLYDIVKEHRDDERLPYGKRPPFDLKKYVYITDEGKKYLNTLNDILKKAEE